LADEARQLASVVIVFPDGERLTLLHLRKAHLRSIDMLIHRIESGFGHAQIKVAHGRIAGYDVLETTRVIDELENARIVRGR
jgi:hypothetical protein